ncbi:MAG: carboxypeptidase-like regulatory domain-containing protein [Methylophagaceae bacterium]
MNLKTFFTALLLTVGLVTSAHTVTGIVTSDDGPLPGATVVVKGTSNGVSTDFDGNFSINAPADAILEVSFVGFSTQDVPVNGQDNLTITLATDNELDEVIVTGYGSQKKKEITSAVALVGEEEFNKGTINDASQLLQGKVAGLSIYNKVENPNDDAVIRLRGLSTLCANASPLVVIDGIIGGSLANLDPSDIESINVLKDGSAASINGQNLFTITDYTGVDPEPALQDRGSVANGDVLNPVEQG